MTSRSARSPRSPGSPGSAGRGPSAADRRFAARARQDRRRRIFRAAAVVVACGVIAGLAWLVGWSGVLAADEVRVEGVDGPVADAVVDTAAVPMGEPLIRIDAEGIASRVRELPEVADVAVERSWPSAVTLDVTMRSPVATVPDDDTWWLVDESGVLFSQSSERPGDLPVAEVGTRDDDAAAREAAVTVIVDLPSEIRDVVAEIRADSAADVRLLLADEVVVRWGTSEDTARKAEVLRTLMAAQEEPVEAYDVSAPESPAVIP